MGFWQLKILPNACENNFNLSLGDVQNILVTYIYQIDREATSLGDDVDGALTVDISGQEYNAFHIK
jgi:hypothetical protein